jgi:RNA polymerase sigma-70 factor, ECF subfamily
MQRRPPNGQWAARRRRRVGAAASALYIGVTMLEPPLPDEVLMEQAAAAQPQAVQGLYQRHGRLVYGIALGILRDPLAAEEVTQDVFLRVWEKAATYQVEKARVVTWIMRIARNQSIDALRRRTARGGGKQAIVEDFSFLADPTAPDPGESAALASRRAEVRAALGGLPADQRTALALAFFQGLTHQQIAEKLGEPLGTVKTRIRDAMRKLRLVLESGEEP